MKEKIIIKQSIQQQVTYLDVVLLIHRQPLCIEKDIVHHKEIQSIAVNLQSVSSIDTADNALWVALHVVRVG